MNDTPKAENPLSQNFTIASLLKFALPTILSMLFMGLYTIVDTIFVARFVNTNALSALNIVCPVINLIVGLGTMLATGGNAINGNKGRGLRHRDRLYDSGSDRVIILFPEEKHSAFQKARP